MFTLYITEKNCVGTASGTTREFHTYAEAYAYGTHVPAVGFTAWAVSPLGQLLAYFE